MSNLTQSAPPPQEGQPQPGPPTAPARFVPPARQEWTPERIRWWRVNQVRCSQRRLAECAGIRPNSISEWETGKARISGVCSRLLDYVAASQAGGDSISAGAQA